MFGLRKKRGNAAQPAAASQQAQESGSHGNASGSVQDATASTATQSHNAQDQAVVDMMVTKSHSRHPHSKDGDSLPAIATGGYPHQLGEDSGEGEEEEDDDDDDDDLFKFMPPAQTAHSQSQQAAHNAVLAPSNSGLGGLLPAHPVASGEPLPTASTDSSVNTNDILAVPHAVGDSRRDVNTPPSVPHTAGDSSWDHSTPAKLAKPVRPGTAARDLTEAQKVAKEYQSSHASLDGKKSEDPDEQHAVHPAALNTGGYSLASEQKRRQPYKYPGSPVYSTTPGSIQAAVDAAAARQVTPRIEPAERQRQPSTMTVSYPPEYDKYPDEGGMVATSNGYSEHFVRIAGANVRGGTYQPETPQTVRHRMSKTYSEHDESKASIYRSDGVWRDAQTPASKDSYVPDYGFERGNAGLESKAGGMGIQSGDGHLRYPTSGRYATEDGMASTAVGSTPCVDGGKDFQEFELEDEEDSPYPEVRASVSNIDDPEMPCLTFRTWLLGLFFCIIGGGVNFFLLIRVPAPVITPLSVQIISYPCGKFLAYILPTAVYKTPKFLRYLGAPSEWSLNPGPFNIKEHAIIVLMVNVAIAPSYALSFTLTLDKYYNIPKGMAFDWLCLITCNCIGFSFAGLCRRYLVWPASLIWPQNLVTCTLFNTFHAEDDDGSDGSLTRFRFFTYIFIGAAVWYIFPGFLFTGLSAFSFLCWIAPRAKVVNQLFGVATGLGMSIFTFDWSQITWIGSPLIVPWWAEVNIFTGFFLLYWLIVPILYYTNTWNFAFMPISTSVNFDRWGQFYNMTRVLTPDITLDEAGYRSYSMLFMSTTYAMVYALSFTLATAAIVHTMLYNGKDIYLKFKNAHTEMEDVHAKLMRNYPEVPDWWYWAIFIVFSAIGIATIEIYDTQLPVWMFLLSLLVAAAYVLPGGFIFALTAQMITVNLIAETIPGYALPGKPIANLLFKTVSIQCLQAAMLFVQDLKIGHYMKIPPRVTFMMQLIGTLVACASQLGVKRALEVLVPDLCQPGQSARLNCAVSSVMFEASVIWGIIGPERFFGSDSPYHALLYFMILGALLPIPFWLLQRRYPRSWVKYINIPVLLNGASYIPPATGINYSSWFIVGFIFQFLLRRFRFRWWSKFCFITSAGLEGGTVFAAIILFFALQLPMNGRLQPSWWGNEVYKNTGDWQGVTHLTAPEEGFGPVTWS